MAVRPDDVTTALEMAVLEQNAVALGVTIDALMENAGRAVAEEAARHLPPAPGRVAVIAGTGNNGGDGTCAAFYLGQWGYRPEIWLVRPPSEIRSSSARRCFDRAERQFPTHLRVPAATELAGFPLLLDALLGSGQSGTLRSPYAEAVNAVETSKVPVLSVDVPTGLGASPSVHPRWTVALTSLKPGMDPTSSGEIVVRDIGIPEEARRRTGPGEFLYFPAPESRGQRGRGSRLVVVGGGPYAGAPALAGLAALRAGVERATVIAPLPAAAAVQAASPNLVVRAAGTGAFRPEDVPTILELLREANPKAVVFGMGAGSAPPTVEAFARLLEHLDPQLGVIVDADALPALRPDGPPAAARSPARWVATPNAGEYARYFGPAPGPEVEARLRAAQERAERLHVTLLGKGDADLLTDGSRSLVNLHHSAAATVSGVGDVLAGVVGALLAQGVEGLAAARLGAYWVGEAGLRVAERKGFGLVATDVIEELPLALVDGVRRVRGES